MYLANSQLESLPPQIGRLTDLTDLNLSAFDEGYAYGLKVLESGPVVEETDGDGKEELESAY